MADRVGQQFDNYRLVRLLRAGGFGEVYLGEHVYHKTEVAVKVLPQLAPDDLQCFLTEARTFRLKHPNIVQVLDFGVEEYIPFVVMEYAPHGTLRQRYPKGTRLPLAEIVLYVKQVASALQYAHDERVIHRDVKPENMLLGRNDEVLLSDFGIATVAHRTSSQNTESIAGTIPYIAPEQIQASPRPASDQYSLGVVVYEWLCGEQPFQGTLAEVAAKHMTMPPPPLHGKVATISPEVEQVVMKALAKDPRQRFGSVLKFAIALEEASRSGESELMTPGLTMNASESQRSEVMASSSDERVRAVVAATASGSSLGEENIRESSPEGGISRRVLIVGLGLAGLAVAGGAIGWLVSSQGRRLFFTGPISKTPTPLSVGTMLYTYRGHADFVNGVAWSPDGRVIASGSSDQTVQVWDALGGNNLAADGGHVFTYRGHSYSVQAVAWSPDGRHITSGSWDNTVQVWPAASGGHVYMYRGHSDGVNVVAWSPDGKRIASASYDKTVQVWHAADGGHAYTYRGHSDIVTAVAWSPDGTRIVSGSVDNTVQMWDAADGGHAYTYRGHANIVNAVAWSPDGIRIASGGLDKTVQVWDVVGGNTIYTYGGHASIVRAVVWSPNGIRIASGGTDKTVQVWHATDGSNSYKYRGHANTVRTVAWSPDGKRIASGSLDKTVQVWRAE